MGWNAKSALVALIAAAVVFPGGVGHGQSYPSRDITFMVPYNPGGATDPIARQFSNQLEKALGVSVKDPHLVCVMRALT